MTTKITAFLASATAAAVMTTSSYAEDPNDAEDVQEPVAVVQCEDSAKSATQCVVSKDTYIGWRTYHSACNHCHAQDAVGSTFAPSLVSGAAKTVDYQIFLERVNDGYTGQIGVMPGFKDNPNINKRIDSIFMYLRARSDGQLPPGRPTRMEE